MGTALRLATAVFALLSIVGCSTNRVYLKYEPEGQRVAITSESGISVGRFVDVRGKDPNWIGAIRGGFGNAVKVIETELPVSAVVANAFADGLEERLGLAKSAGGGYEIRGTIKRFDCDQYARREATVEIEISVIRQSNSSVVYSETKSANVVIGSVLTVPAGIFGSVEDLRLVAEQALRQIVDAVLDDPEFRKAVEN